MHHAARSPGSHAVISRLLVVSLTVAASTLRAQSAGAPVRIPGPGEGYQITRSETSKMAPSGYEGRTDNSTLTAIGNTPATTGKRVVARFTLGNQVKTCPKADGSAEGEGELSFTIQSTDAQPSGTSSAFIEGRATAKYKGEVSDDGLLHSPVQAEIDYVYSLKGTLRDPSGAIATPAGSNVTQHITLPFTVGGAMMAPTIGTFTGGDPTKGHYAEAVGVGTALTYWAGVWYSIAMTRWQQPGTCVNVAFDPPSNTVKVAAGVKTTVAAQVKTKAGESVKAQFRSAHPIGGPGSVEPATGTSETGAPMKFRYTIADRAARNPGFSVDATSRAGVASGEWHAGVGTDWSGQIELTVALTGDEGANDLQSWSNSSATRIAIDVKNGVGTAKGYTEEKYIGINRQKALRGGALTMIIDQSTSIDGSHEDSAPAVVAVFNPTNDTYAIRLDFLFRKEGKAHVKSCKRETCTDSEKQMVITAMVPPLGGPLTDPNHLSGSKTDVKSGVGHRGTGKITTTVTWNLARQGNAK